MLQGFFRVTLPVLMIMGALVLPFTVNSQSWAQLKSKVEPAMAALGQPARRLPHKVTNIWQPLWTMVAQ
jgi:hypothetical protein